MASDSGSSSDSSDSRDPLEKFESDFRQALRTSQESSKGRSFVETSLEGSNEGTVVDLGEDLLTAPVRKPENTRSEALTAQDLQSKNEDDFESARILASEGLIEDAKRLLRQLLVRDSGHVPARQLLDQVHASELEQLLQAEAPQPKKPSYLKKLASEPSSEEVLHQLESTLGMTLDEAGQAKAPEFPLNVSEIDSILAGASARDRLDFGIAFHEMGQWALAARQFALAMHDPEARSVACALYAQSLLSAGNPAEALIALEEVLVEGELSAGHRAELNYLAGKAYEALEQFGPACLHYFTADQAVSNYRDARDRLLQLDRRARGLG